jgi:hypothetical protein
MKLFIYWKDQVVPSENPNLSGALDHFLDAIEEKKKEIFMKVPDAKNIIERTISEPFKYKVGNQEEVMRAHAWKRLDNQWRSQIKCYDSSVKLKPIIIERQRKEIKVGTKYEVCATRCMENW